MRDNAALGDLVALWQGDDGVDQRTARAVIDLAMRVGETLLATGASATDVVATALSAQYHAHMAFARYMSM